MDEGASCRTEDDGRTVRIHLPQAKRIHRVVMMEDLHFSQRVEKFEIDAMLDGQWRKVYAGTVIGHKRIAVLDPVETEDLRIRITDVRVKPVMRFTGVYE